MSFADIFGHKKEIAQLRRAIEDRRVPHAFLFSGTEGIGKRTTAAVFAKALNCRNESGDSCDRCPSCRKADQDIHPDMITLRPDGQFIKIQAIRDLQEQMKFKPWEGRTRVCIIDDAERMHDAAANALLKTLEEPPPSNVILLISARPFQLPPTILSRCRHMRFNPLSEEEVSAFAVQCLSLDSEGAGVLASFSGGSIARAEALQRGSYLEVRNGVLMILGQGADHEPLRRLSLVDHLGKSKEEALDKLAIARLLYHDAMVYRETGKSERLRNRDRLDIIDPLSRRLSTPEMINNIRLIDWTYRALEQNADKTLTLEVMAFNLTW